MSLLFRDTQSIPHFTCERTKILIRLVQINDKSFRFCHGFTWNLRLHEFSWRGFVLGIHSNLIHERFNCATLKQTELIQGKYTIKQ